MRESHSFKLGLQRPRSLSPHSQPSPPHTPPDYQRARFAARDLVPDVLRRPEFRTVSFFDVQGLFIRGVIGALICLAQQILCVVDGELIRADSAAYRYAFVVFQFISCWADLQLTERGSGCEGKGS